jgi:hypothetical protein
MWKLFKYLLPLIILSNTAVYAQTEPAIEAKTDKNKVTTGETFTYKNRRGIQFTKITAAGIQ